MKFKVYYQQNSKLKNKIFYANSKQALYDENILPKNIIKIKEDIWTLSWNKKIKEDDIIDMFYSLKTMLNASLALNETLDLAIRANKNNKNIYNILINMAFILQNGAPLYTSLLPYKKQIGTLPILFLQLSEYGVEIKYTISSLLKVLKQNKKSKDKITKSLQYSLTLFISLVVSVFIIIVFVLPNFESIFNQLQGELPIYTKSLLWIRDFVSFYYNFIALFIILFIFSIWFIFNKYTYQAHKFLATKLGIISNLIKLFLLYRLFLVVYIMVKAKYNFQDSLEKANITTNNLFIKNEIRIICVSIKKGSSISNAFINSQLNDDLICKMFTIAGSTNLWSKCLKDLNTLLEKKLNNQIQSFASIIEPTFILILSFVILWLVLAIMLPMWSLGGNLS